MSENFYKPFYMTIYDPANSAFKTKKTEPASYTVYYCRDCEGCEALKRGQCAMRLGNWGVCPCGKKQTSQGYSQKAKKYYDFLAKAKEQYADIYVGNTKNYLSAIDDVVDVGGGYVFLPLPHLNNYVNPIDEELGIVKEHFIPKANFTVETIKRLMEFRPRALFGGEIKGYQQELPKFLLKLRNYSQELFGQFMEAYPEYKTMVADIDYVGKKALVTSLLPGMVKLGQIEAQWDGKFIKTKLSDQFGSRYGDGDVTITPERNTVVEILDNATVDPSRVKLIF